MPVYELQELASGIEDTDLLQYLLEVSRVVVLDSPRD